MRPELSVAIIFKNEIRCLERCLKSLQPLKERVSCEIVMADTGSTDGSRAVAEKYADEVFDFPWIDDFAAARNAVLERCGGKWALTVDCDEWLDGDIDELASFLKSEQAERCAFAWNIVRNYTSGDLLFYEDFLALRLMRLDAEPRYEGAIHEAVKFSAGSGGSVRLNSVILHHDGYVMLNDGSEEGRNKQLRNVKLLRAELEKAPDDMRRQLQYLDCARYEKDYHEAIRRTVDSVIRKKPGWNQYGDAIMRHAVFEANARKMPELNVWIEKARELFPKSYYVRIDVAYVELALALARSDYEKAIACAENCLAACAEFQNDPEGHSQTSAGGLKKVTGYWQQYIRLRLACAYHESGQNTRALSILEQTEWTLLDGENTTYFALLLKDMARGGADVGSLLNACWEGIQKPVPSAEHAAKRVDAFREQISVETAEPAQEGRVADRRRRGMRPELSVAIIFKNEIRCIERCLKSLQPLKKRVSCEIVMADTGSTDGSRAVAEKYADEVFDFPWIDDFAAARNAVLERCGGKWALTVDCDEWLDGDIDELVSFLRGSARGRFDQVMLTIRNYASADLMSYGDSRAYRLLNLASEPRFEGAIHESPEFARKPRNGVLERTLLHHDGYVMLNDGSQAGRAKAERNVRLLRAELEKEPDDLRRLSQFLESGAREQDYIDRLRRAVSLVKAGAPECERYGAMLLRFAVQTAYDRGLPELDEWAELALSQYPGSYFTRVDVAYTLAARDFNRDDFKGAVRHGEDYLRARGDLKADAGACRELDVGVLQRDGGDNERDIRAILAHAYLQLGQPETALSQLKNWAWEETDGRQVKNFLIALQEIRNRSALDVAPLLLDCRARIRRPIPSEKRAQERMAAFQTYCAIAISEPAEVPPELLALAEKVRALLKKLPPDDPMAIELKNSEAYQKIAFLLEGN